VPAGDIWKAYDAIMQAEPASPTKLPVTWWNVLVGLSILLLDVAISYRLNLGIAKDLLIAASRCIVQLALLGLILESVFAAQNVFAVVGMSLAMLLLGANEVTFSRSKKRSDGLFTSTLVSLVVSVAPITIIGSRFAIRGEPFWSPQSFIPILGMITGNAISGTAVSANFITKEVTENKDKIETYLAFGATRMEACLPLARDALKLSLLPTVNQMSVIGLISIPGMMTGAILGGADVAEAARMQMIITFLLTACTTLCVSVSIYFLLSTLVDDKHRIRLDRVNERPLWPVLLFQAGKQGALDLWRRYRGGNATSTRGYVRMDEL